MTDIKDVGLRNLSIFLDELTEYFKRKEMNFWDSVGVKDLSPTQKRHFRAIMRKEVRSK